MKMAVRRSCGEAAPGVTVQVADSLGPLSIESTAEEFLCIVSMLSAFSSHDDLPVIPALAIQPGGTA